MTAVLLAAMVNVAAPQGTQDSRPACAVGDERDDSRPNEPTRWITNLEAVFALPVPQAQGQRISVRNARVSQVDPTGFWITGSNHCRLFIVPAEGSLIHVEPGEVINLQGELRLRSRAHATFAPSLGAYVYAYIVRKTPPEH